jgi:hypothetical protein
MKIYFKLEFESIIGFRQTHRYPGLFSHSINP